MEFFDGFLIDIYAFVISSNGFSAEVVDFLIVGILFDNHEIALGDVILTLEAIEEVESLVEVGNAKDIDGTEHYGKGEERNFDGWLNLAVNHGDTEPNSNHSEYGKSGYEIGIWQEIDSDYHCAENCTANQ